MNVSKRKIHKALKRNKQSRKKNKHRQTRKSHTKSAKHKKHTNLLFKTIKQYHKSHNKRLEKHKSRKFYGGVGADEKTYRTERDAAMAKMKALERQPASTSSKDGKYKNVHTQPNITKDKPQLNPSVQWGNINNKKTSPPKKELMNPSIKTDIDFKQQKSKENALAVLKKDMRNNGVPYAFYSNINAKILLKQDVTKFDRLLSLNKSQLDDLYQLLQVSDVTKNRTNKVIKQAKTSDDDAKNKRKGVDKDINKGKLNQLLKDKQSLEKINKDLEQQLQQLENQQKKGERTCFDTVNKDGDVIRICVEDDKSFNNWVNNAVKPKKPKKIKTTKNIKLQAQFIKNNKKPEGKNPPAKK